MKSHRRVERLNQLLREEISRLVRRELNDPRVRGVTVTGVETTPDLRHAKVYVRTLRDEPGVDEALEGLHSAQGYIRGTLGRQLRLRRIPELHFEADRTLERASRIESLLDRALSSEEDDDGRRS